MTAYDPTEAPLDCNGAELFEGDTVRLRDAYQGVRLVGEVVRVSPTHSGVVDVRGLGVIVKGRADMWERIKQGATSKLQEN